MDPEHASIVLNLLNKQRSDPTGNFTDVRLIPTKDEQRRELRAHKCLVALNPNISMRLNEVTSPTNKSEFCAELDITYPTLEGLLNFMYTGKCEFKQENIIDMIQAASEFGMERLRSKAQDYLKVLTNIDISSPVPKSDSFPVSESSSFEKRVTPTGAPVDRNRYPWLTAGFFHLASQSPLMAVMEFLPVCRLCAVATADQSTFYQKELFNHGTQCSRDLLLARKIGRGNEGWKRIRPIPFQAIMSGSNNTAQFQICKEIKAREPCKYDENCTFAQSEEELEFWNAERRGDFIRYWIAGHINGIDCFKYLKCINKRYEGNFTFKSITTDPAKPKRQLIHEREVRIRDPRNRQVEICWHEDKERGSCKLGDQCHFAHSNLELEVWILLRSTNLSAQQLVQFSESGKVVKRKSPENTIFREQLSGIPVPPIDQIIKNVYFQCGKCYSSRGLQQTKTENGFCLEDNTHQGMRVVLVEDIEGKVVQARNIFGVFKNHTLPQKFVFCQKMHEKGECSYQNACLFPHSISEHAVWNYQLQRNVRDHYELFTAILDEVSDKEPRMKRAFFAGEDNTQ